jgi:bifunctional NMN adenylyltransferase/nudix hydrolase
MKESTLGVIIARFQVPELHMGHRFLIESVLEQHEQVLVILGANGNHPVGGKHTKFGAMPNNRNPLSYEMRKQMLLAAYPRLLIEQVLDCRSDQQWSERIDSCISELHGGTGAVLYGSRDSFKSYYSGSHPIVEIEERPSPSGKVIRAAIGLESFNSTDFRKGVIYAQEARPGIVFPVVDIIVSPMTNQASTD